MTRGVASSRHPPSRGHQGPTGAGTVLLSSRIRLARNLAGAPFPDWSTEEKRKAVFKRLEPAIIEAGARCGSPLTSFPLESCRDKDFTGGLIEDNVISRQLLARDTGAGFFLPEQTGGKTASPLVVMVNEEDHIRIQVFRENGDLEDAWAQADRFDSQLGQRVEYAFSSQLGYLTACPSNLGTAMRASVMLFLPALQLLDDLDSTSRAVQVLGFNVRGRNGEGTLPSAGTIQISNAGTLGRTEEEVIASLRKVSDEVIRLEIQARRYLMNKASVLLDDLVARSLSLLQTAWLLQSEEAYQALAVLRLGVELGLVRGISVERISTLIETTGHCHVHRAMSYSQEPPEQADDPDILDAYRAAIVRKETKRAKFLPLAPAWE